VRKGGYGSLSFQGEVRAEHLMVNSSDRSGRLGGLGGRGVEFAEDAGEGIPKPLSFAVLQGGEVGHQRRRLPRGGRLPPNGNEHDGARCGTCAAEGRPGQ